MEEANEETDEEAEATEDAAEALEEAVFVTGNAEEATEHAAEATEEANMQQGPDEADTVAGHRMHDCPVCYDGRPSVVDVPCGHVACKPCSSMMVGRPCPICRAVPSSVLRIFLWRPGSSGHKL